MADGIFKKKLEWLALSKPTMTARYPTWVFGLVLVVIGAIGTRFSFFNNVGGGYILAGVSLWICFKHSVEPEN
jgi:hypothetical protein